MFAVVAAKKVVDILPEGSSLLDIGCGPGQHTKFFREMGMEVMSLDHEGGPHRRRFQPDVLGDFMDVDIDRRFDAVWACHVLEHQVNPGMFLEKVLGLLRVGGIAAISVPPLKHPIVGGHVTLWNAGLMLYQLVLAGFDCSKAAIKSYGYNISVIVPRPEEEVTQAIRSTELFMDKGDIERLSKFFPVGCRRQNFRGVIRERNWDPVIF